MGDNFASLNFNQIVSLQTRSHRIEIYMTVTGTETINPLTSRLCYFRWFTLIQTIADYEVRFVWFEGTSKIYNWIRLNPSDDAEIANFIHHRTNLTLINSGRGSKINRIIICHVRI